MSILAAAQEFNKDVKGADYLTVVKPLKDFIIAHLGMPPDSNLRIGKYDDSIHKVAAHVSEAFFKEAQGTLDDPSGTGVEIIFFCDDAGSQFPSWTHPKTGNRKHGHPIDIGRVLRQKQENQIDALATGMRGVEMI